MVDTITDMPSRLLLRSHDGVGLPQHEIGNVGDHTVTKVFSRRQPLIIGREISKVETQNPRHSATRGEQGRSCRHAPGSSALSAVETGGAGDHPGIPAKNYRCDMVAFVSLFVRHHHQRLTGNLYALDVVESIH